MQCIDEDTFPSFWKLAKVETFTLLNCTKWTDTVPHKLSTDKLKKEEVSQFMWISTSSNAILVQKE